MEEEYKLLLKSGMFWEFHPELSGNWNEDKEQFTQYHKARLKMKKVYYARPINLYNTPQDVRDIELLQTLGFEVINPNKAELEARYKEEGMSVFLQAAQECDVIAFRSFPDLKISAGVVKEITECGKPVIELPTITSHRCLSVEDTREYLKLLGNR